MHGFRVWDSQIIVHDATYPPAQSEGDTYDFVRRLAVGGQGAGWQSGALWDGGQGAGALSVFGGRGAPDHR